MQPPADRTLVNLRPPNATTVYIAPSPLLDTYPAWLLRIRKTRRTR